MERNDRKLSLRHRVMTMFGAQQNALIPIRIFRVRVALEDPQYFLQPLETFFWLYGMRSEIRGLAEEQGAYSDLIIISRIHM